jgi:hypothetical protein
VPTLSEWALILFALTLAALGVGRANRGGSPPVSLRS